VEEAAGGFLGEIDQVPPAYSAAKVTGRRAYDLARRGQAVELAARRVRVYGIDVLEYDYPRLDLEVRCGKGTYIRSLARDLGDRLGCGALVETLRRTRVGPFEASAGLPLEADAATARNGLLPLSAAVADLPRVTLTQETAGRLRRGQVLPLADLPGEAVPAGGTAEVAVFDPDGVLVAVAVAEPAAGRLRPGKVVAG
jgi:tRNA pseudouridine55 synthase